MGRCKGTAVLTILATAACQAPSEPTRGSPAVITPIHADSIVGPERQVAFAEVTGSAAGRLGIRAVVYVGLGCDELTSESDAASSTLHFRVIATRIRSACVGTDGYEVYGEMPRVPAGTYRTIVTFRRGDGTLETLLDQQVQVSDTPETPIEGDHWQ